MKILRVLSLRIIRTITIGEQRKRCRPIVTDLILNDDDNIINSRYLSFEYDHGGWNNGRLGYEALVVLAHAMGRTLVVPPQQHLYLMALNHKDKDDQKEHDEMGFLDFYDINLMRTQKGFHVMEMPEFLAKEGVTGGLHNRLPPGNSTQAWGKELWKYLAEVVRIHHL